MLSSGVILVRGFGGRILVSECGMRRAAKVAVGVWLGV